MSALLTGVNRAFPYTVRNADKNSANLKLEEQLSVMFRLVHMCPFNTAVQALMLVYQIMDTGESATDRFYSALYKKILDPNLSGSTKITLFLNLVYKSMKKDASVNRVKAYVKRLLQVCHNASNQVACGIVILVSEVIRSRPDLAGLRDNLAGNASGMSSLLAKFDDDEDDEEEHYVDVKDEPKEEPDAEAEEAEIEGEEEEDDDDSESETESVEMDGDFKIEPESQDEEEEKVDVKEEESEEQQPKAGPSSSSSTWVHKKNMKTASVHRKIADYDPLHRNPSFSGAENALVWELDLLSSHFHPSVALFAQTVLDGRSVKYGGDPLQDFTLMRFLDRFVFRNPKKDPLKGKPTTALSGKRGAYAPKGVKNIAPDSKEYVNLEESSIPLDERFIYRYLKEKRATKTDEQESDAESVTSEDFNDFLDSLPGSAKVDDVDMDFAGGVDADAANDGDLNASDDDDVDGDLSEGVEEDESFDEAAEPKLEGEDSDNSDFEDLQGSDDDDDEDEIDEEGFANSDNDDEDEFDEEAFENSDNNEEEEPKSKKKRKLESIVGSKRKIKFGKGGSGGDLQSLLASAEEFADLVEESAADDLDIGGLNAVSNSKDKKAGKKQMKWEKTRFNEGEGGSRRQHKKAKGGGGGKKFGGGGAKRKFSKR